jgi:hypothetical protein
VIDDGVVFSAQFDEHGGPIYREDYRGSGGPNRRSSDFPPPRYARRPVAQDDKAKERAQRESERSIA